MKLLYMAKKGFLENLKVIFEVLSNLGEAASQGNGANWLLIPGGCLMQVSIKKLSCGGKC